MTVDLDLTPITTAVLTTAEAAADELTRSGSDHRAVVGWLSRHAAALEHAVFPIARRELSAGEVAAQEDLTRRLEHVLLQLHQSLSGDGRGTRLEVPNVTERLRYVLATHVAGLDALLDRLAEVLSDDAWSALLAAHADALHNAPSRPHPHTPHGRLGERFAFPIAGAVDRLLDALDSRIAPPLPAQRDAGVSQA